MSTRQEEPENDEARQSSADGATATLPRDTNADDTEPGAGDQDIDTAGTEADELSASHDALGLPKSDGGLGPPKPAVPGDGGLGPPKPAVPGDGGSPTKHR